jgi:hypothetical protein
MSAVRGWVLLLAGTEYETVPFPLPEAPAVIVIDESAEAIQAQPDGAVTLKVPVPP